MRASNCLPNSYITPRALHGNVSGIWGLHRLFLFPYVLVPGPTNNGIFVEFSIDLAENFNAKAGPDRECNIWGWLTSISLRLERLVLAARIIGKRAIRTNPCKRGRSLVDEATLFWDYVVYSLFYSAFRRAYMTVMAALGRDYCMYYLLFVWPAVNT